MADIRTKLGLEIDPEGIIAQFEGYFQLEDLDWAHYKEKYGNIYRMDRILNAEGKSADSYKVAKQADSLMIFYNFSKSKSIRFWQIFSYQLPTDYIEKISIITWLVPPTARLCHASFMPSWRQW